MPTAGLRGRSQLRGRGEGLPRLVGVRFEAVRLVGDEKQLANSWICQQVQARDKPIVALVLGDERHAEGESRCRDETIGDE